MALRTLAKRVHTELAHGSISKAARELNATPLAELTPEALAQLHALHPTEPPPPVPHRREPAPQLEEEAVSKLLQSLPKDSAAGASGWRYEHLQSAVRANPQVLPVLTQFINLTLEGRVPHIPELLDCTLLAFATSAGGVRPIAIGEIWYRVAALAALSTTASAGMGMAPLQMAWGISGGNQVVGYALQTGMLADIGCVTVSMD